MRRWIAFAGAGAVALALALLLGGGTAPLGRVALSLGMPGLASALFDDPAWRGVAEFRAGRFEAAAEDFGAARAYFNLGDARAWAGQHSAALEAYDIARLGGDDAAAANFDLLAAYYAGLALDPDVPIAWFAEKDGGEDPAVESFVGEGNARAASTGDGVTNTGALLGLPELESRGEQRRVRRIFDDHFIVANDRWLATLKDVPGEYLAARIAHERKRRATLGLAPPEPEDPS